MCIAYLELVVAGGGMGWFILEGFVCLAISKDWDSSHLQVTSAIPLGFL